MTASPSWLEPSASSQQKQQPTWLEPHQPQPQEQKPSWLAQPRPLPPAGTQPPNHGSSGLYGQNPTVDVLADFNRNWVAGKGGVRPQFRSAVHGLIGQGYRLGVYDFDAGHGDPNHLGSSDPHLEGRAMDVDTINGVPVDGTLTPTLAKFIMSALNTNPNIRIGVGGDAYEKMKRLVGNRVFLDKPTHVHVQLDIADTGSHPTWLDQHAKPAHAVAAKAPPKRPASVVPLGGPMDSPDQSSAAGPIEHAVTNTIGSGMRAIAAYGEPLTLNSPALGLLIDGHPEYVKDAWHTLTAGHFGPGAFAAVNDKYGVFSPANISKLYHDDPTDPVLRFLHSHPTLDDVAVRGLADLIGLNPAHGLSSLSKLMRLERVTPMVGEAALRLPGARSVVAAHKALQRAWSPYGVLRQADVAGMTADEIEQVGRRFKGAEGTVNTNAVSAVTSYFPRGLTREQRIEIERRSEGLPPNHNVPQPNAKVLQQHGDLDTLAAHRRSLYTAATDDAVARQLLPATSVNDRSTYSYRGGPLGKVYIDPNAAHPDEITASQRSYTRRGGRIFSGPETTQHKTYQTYDEAAASGKLSPRYDPYDNDLTYFTKRGMKAYLQDVGHDFTAAGLAQGMEYRAPGSDAVIGVGKPGYEAAQKVAQRLGRRQAFAETVQHFANQGIPLSEIRSGRAARPQTLAGKATEAERARAGMETQQVGPRTEARVLNPLERRAQAALNAMADQRPFEDVNANLESSGEAPMTRNEYDATRAAASKAREKEARGAYNTVASAQVGAKLADKLYGPDSTLARRVTKLNTDLVTAKTNKLHAIAFQRAVEAQAKAHAARYLDQMQGEAEEGARRAGLMSSKRVGEEGLLPHGSLPKYIAAKPELVQFLQHEGAGAGEARDAGSMLDGFNQLYRMGIITNPVRHIFWNLGLNYIAATGGKGLAFFNPLAKHSLWKNAAGQPWDKAAESYGAHQSQAIMHPIFGGEDMGTTMQTPLSKVYGETSQEFGGGVRGAVRGAGGVVNAAATRGWQWNQRLVFDMFERRYATDLFRHYAQDMGVTDASRTDSEARAAFAKAGILTRKALGDYLNTSRTGIEATLQKTLLFYPWLKTVIPFWGAQLVQHPQFVWGPYAGIHEWNEHRGDPNADHEAPGAIYLGSDKQGNPQYASWPGPQSHVAQLAEAIAPRGDVQAGLDRHLAPAQNLVSSELNPAGKLAFDTATTVAGPDQEPGFNTMFQKSAPLGVQAQQAVQHELGVVPFAQLVQNIGKGVQEPLIAALNAATVNTYSTPSKRMTAATNMLNRAYEHYLGQINAGVKAGVVLNGVKLTPAVGHIFQSALYDMFALQKQFVAQYVNVPRDDPRWLKAQAQMQAAVAKRREQMQAEIQAAQH